MIYHKKIKTKNNIGDYSTEIVNNKINNLQFYLSSFIDPITLNKLKLNLKYTYNLQKCNKFRKYY